MEGAAYGMYSLSVAVLGIIDETSVLTHRIEIDERDNRG